MASTYLTQHQRTLLLEALREDIQDGFDILEEIGTGGININQLLYSLSWIEKLEKEESDND